MKKIPKWIGRITTAVLFMVLFSVIFMVFASNLNGGTIFGYQLKTVLSGSMEPDIQTGSIIAVKPTQDVKHFQKGDVVTFNTQDHGQVTHRIYQVKNNGDQYVTKGNNNNAPDTEPLMAHNIEAQYTGFTLPYVGYAVHYTSTKAGTALLLVIPGLLLLCYAGVTIWKAFREIEGKADKKTAAEGKEL